MYFKPVQAISIAKCGLIFIFNNLKINNLYNDFSFAWRLKSPVRLALFSILIFLSKTAYSQVELTFSRPPGWHTEAFDLEISINFPNADIYYTLNGELPDTNSTRYDVPLFIDKKITAPHFAAVPTAPEYWQPPQGEVFQLTILRVAAFVDGARITPYRTLSFGVNEAGNGRYSFPVISLVAEARHFFDSTEGIHVPGSIAEQGNLHTGNYYQRGREWERPVHIEYFEADGTLAVAQNIGVRMHGQFSRQLPQKSMRLYARTEYGAKHFNYAFFEQKNDVDQFKRLVLRAANPNNFHVPFKDELCHLLVREMGLDYQAFTPVVAFMNGEYWGIFNLKERHDRYYIQSNYGIDDDEVDMLERSGDVIDGEPTAWQEMMDFVRQNDLAINENYTQLQTWLDVDNFMDFVIAEMYLELWDFPENNLKYWRERSPNARWQWLFNDGDAAMHEYWKSKFRELITPLTSEYDDLSFVILLRKLLANADFKARLHGRFLYHLNHTLSPNNVLHKIDSLTQIYDSVMPEHIRRWGYPATMNDYHTAVAHIREFAALRPANLVAELEEILGQPFSIFPNPAREEFYIQWDDNAPNLAANYVLYNALGQGVASDILEGNPAVVRVADLKCGVYFLQVFFEGVYYGMRIVKH